MKVRVGRLQKSLDCLEIALDKHVDVAPMASREQLVKGLQTDVDNFLVLGTAPGNVPADFLGQVFSYSVKLLGRRHAIVSQGVLQPKLVKTTAELLLKKGNLPFLT